jgi:hypothetical protein
MESFEYTNAFQVVQLVAIYTQQMNKTSFVDFTGIAAGVSLETYIVTIIACFLLVLVFIIINYLNPSETFSYWHITTVILPCFNGQAKTALRIDCFHRMSSIIFPRFLEEYFIQSPPWTPALEHLNSPSRVVAIITNSIFVFLFVTLYQTLLLSSTFLASDRHLIQSLKT